VLPDLQPENCAACFPEPSAPPVKVFIKKYGILSFSQLAINGLCTLAKFVRKNVSDIAFHTCLGQYKIILSVPRFAQGGQNLPRHLRGQKLVLGHYIKTSFLSNHLKLKLYTRLHSIFPSGAW